MDLDEELVKELETALQLHKKNKKSIESSRKNLNTFNKPPDKHNQKITSNGNSSECNAMRHSSLENILLNKNSTVYKFMSNSSEGYSDGYKKKNKSKANIPSKKNSEFHYRMRNKSCENISLKENSNGYNRTGKKSNIRSRENSVGPTWGRQKSKEDAKSKNIKNVLMSNSLGEITCFDEQDMLDVQELTSYFLLPKKCQEPVSYAECEKQGAIPKSGARTGDSKANKKDINLKKNLHVGDHPNGKPKKSRNAQVAFTEHWEASDADGEILNLKEEVCLKPFYYVVPKDPSPNFFFSRGTYYVVPGSVVHPGDDVTVFHPEKGATVEEEQKNPRTERSAGLPCKENDLGGEFVPNIDSHLNIGPRDMKLLEFTNNLEKNYEIAKSYREKIWGILAFLSSEVVNLFLEKEALSDATLLDFCENRAPDESDIKSVATTELVEDKNCQLTKQIGVLSELELKEEDETDEDDDEVPLDDKKNWKEYKEWGVKKKSLQLSYMLSVLPDADVNYLYKVIDSFGGNDETLENRIFYLMESNDYPKTPLTGTVAREKERLWNLYVKDFNVKRFSSGLMNPEDLAGTSSHDINAYDGLVIRFLKSRYPEENPSLLESEYTFHNRNLIKACESLDAISAFEPVRLSESTFYEEAFDEAFLRQICYIDHREEIKNFLKEQKEMKEVELVDARLNNFFLSCPLCGEDELVASEAVTCPEGDVFCKDCIKRYAFTKLAEGVSKFPCPMEKCETFFTTDTLENILPEKVSNKIIKMQQIEEIRMANIDGLESCPFCEFSYIPDPEDKVFKCQDCSVELCRLCGEKSHIPLRCEEVEKPAEVTARKKIEEAMTETLVRICPTCGKKFVKIDGCNKMSCTCGTIICYICRKKISGYDHFHHGCPLHSRNEDLHEVEVLRSGIKVKNEILKEDPNLSIKIDPTLNGKKFI